MRNELVPTFEAKTQQSFVFEKILTGVFSVRTRDFTAGIET